MDLNIIGGIAALGLFLLMTYSIAEEVKKEKDKTRKFVIALFWSIPSLLVLFLGIFMTFFLPHP